MMTQQRSTFAYMRAALILLSMLIFPLALSLMHPAAAHARTGTPTSKVAATAQHPFCQRLGHSIQASSGAQMWCFGPHPNGPNTVTASNPSFGSNVDAANPREDVTPAGLEAYGQSETSIAAIDSYAVEAWNDATGFFANCGAPLHKEELTGYGFSADGGKSFKDMGGLPNNRCNAPLRLFGDPSVETWRSAGSDYFYISSLYFNPNFTGLTYLAINACKATGSGSTASLSCSQPIIAATSTECVTSSGTLFCSFLDKEFLSIDPQRGRLYMSYTEFGVIPGEPLFNGAIELAVCDIGQPDGLAGSQGGTAGHPVCFPGQSSSPTTPGKPYLVINPGNVNCENEGAYPAVDVQTGDVYVAWEFNWFSSIFGPSPCFSEQMQNIVAFVSHSCLTLPHASCSAPTRTTAINIKSLSGASIPGYNRFPMNDFPRIAVSDPAGTVSIVWNDARLHPFGDIFLQSFTLASLGRIQSSPVRIDSGTGGWHFLPGMRRADAAGRLYVSFYCRADGNTAITNVCATDHINPRTTSTPGNNRIVTTGPSNWNAVSSDIIPNFGDYTDNYLIATAAAPYVGNVLYVAWSDGRLGDPQPFEAHTQTT